MTAFQKGGLDPMQNSITFSLNGFYREDKTAQGFVSYCPTLNVYSHGDSPEEAMTHLKQSVVLYLETCLKRETLDRVLKNSGFIPQAGGLPEGTPLSELEEEFIAVKKSNFDRAFEIKVPFALLPQTKLAHA
jgi:predicted RNase H-like HicB family nuclease